MLDFHPTSLGLPGLSVLELGRDTRQTDGRTDKHRASFYNAPPMAVGHNNANDDVYRAIIIA